VAGISGVLRGLLPDGYVVASGAKVGDLDPSAEPAFCYMLSDRALAIGSGVLAAVLELWPRLGAAEDSRLKRRRGRRPSSTPEDQLLSVAEFALLGLLRERPAHGYDLSRLVAPDTDLGIVFRLGRSQLYASLVKLESHSLVKGETAESASARGRRVFHVTDRGDREFLDWAMRPVPSSRYIRIDFLTKLYFARRLGQEVAARLVSDQLWSLEGELGQGLGSGANSYRDEVLSVGAGFTDAALTWLRALPEAQVPA